MNPESIVMFQNAGIGIMTFLVLATLYTVISPMLEGDKLKKRMSSVSTARDNLRDAHIKSLNRTADGLRTEGKGSIKRLVDNLSLERLLAAPDLKDKLAQAGFRGQKPHYLFYFSRLVLPIGFLVLGLLFFVILNVGNWPMSRNLLVTMFLVVLGYYLPGLFLKNVAKKRLASISPVFPDGLDLLLICVESGMSVELAFGRVSKELAENSVELAEELSLTTAELSYLQSRRMAYENLARRNNHPGIKAVSTALIQAERYGTPLGDALRTMAHENRQLRILAAEKKAAALPAKLTVPMIIFFVPVLFIVILTPAIMRLGGAF